MLTNNIKIKLGLIDTAAKKPDSWPPDWPKPPEDDDDDEEDED